MTAYAILDFESRSRADLTKVGGRLYWEHPSTEALCAVVHRTDRDGPTLWLPGMPAPDLRGARLVAHNAFNFDRFAAARTWGTTTDPAAWVDSSDLAKRLGYAGALSALGAKDKVGSKFTKALSSVKRPREISAAEWRTLTPAEKRERGVLPWAVRPPEVDAKEWKRMTPDEQFRATLTRVVEYCFEDVALLVARWPELAEALDVDVGMSEVSAAINDRGVWFDAALAGLLLYRDAELCETTIASAAAELGCTTDELRACAGSPKQFCAATGAPNAQKQTVDELAKQGCAVSRARQALASIVRGKLRAGLLTSSADGRIRDMHTYYGGHPGRYSGAKLQPQNLTRPAGKYEGWGDAEFDALITELLSRPATGEEIDLLLRACICAEPGHVLVAADWSGIEARVLAWLAHDTEELARTVDGIDPYKYMATQIYGVEYDAVEKPQRQVGKVGVLACGYQGGEGAIEKFADGMGIDLAAAGVSGADIVSAWREAHRPTVQFWYALLGAFRRAAFGERCDMGDFKFVPYEHADGRVDVAMVLPSGRPIVYRNVREAGEERNGKRGLVYESRDVKKNFIPDDRGVGGSKIYGGLLAENATQAVCRCILARALATCHDRGIPVVLHVHDEIVAEVPKEVGHVTYDALVSLMCDLPDWLRDSHNERGDCPLAASGWVGERYRK